MATINVINSSDPIEVASGGTGVATLTDNGVLVGSGTSDITALSVGTNGQTLIGSTAADPAMAAVTSTGSTITITPGAGTLDFKANILDVIWEEYTGTATTMTTNFGYIANNGAEIEFTLPTTAAVGDLLKVAGKGAGKYKIAQASGQTIHKGPISNQAGVNGSLVSDDRYGAVSLVCSVEDKEWTVLNSSGDVELADFVPRTWTKETSNFGAYRIRTIANDGTYSVIAGYEGKMCTATDPSGTWTARTSSFGTSDIFALEYLNSGWLAGGISGKLATASDPTSTWTQHADSSFGTTIIRSFAYYDGVYVAVGSTGKLATATSATGTWTQHADPKFGTDSIYNVAYNDGVWVTCGNNGKIATATDPTGTWTLNSGASNPFTDWVHVTYYADNIWVACTELGEIGYATDPAGTWTLVADSSFLVTDVLFDVAYNNGVWLCVGEGGKIAYATDPTGTWTQIVNTGATGTIYEVDIFNGYWIIGNISGEVLTSPIIT